jgi:hypothetical protein
LENALRYGQDPFDYLDEQSKSGNGRAAFGTVSSLQAPAVVMQARGVGRPGILGDEYGVIETIDKMIEANEIPEIGRGWKIQLARQLQFKIPQLREGFSAKSISDALSDAGVFDRLEEQSEKRERR